MAEETFADLGRVEAISKLYEGTPYKPFQSSWFETSGKSYISSQSRTFLEGIDFDLTYFPLKHLGYKCVTAVTGELYAEMSHPRTMDVRLGISSKLDFKHIKEVWEGMTAAAKEHGYKQVTLDLAGEHLNGLLDLQCIADVGTQRLAHAGDDGSHGLAGQLADLRHGLGQTDGVIHGFHQRAGAGLDVQDDGVRTGSELLGHNGGGDQRQAVHRGGHVPQGVQFLIGGSKIAAPTGCGHCSFSIIHCPLSIVH